MISGCAERGLPIEVVGSGSKRAIGRPMESAVTLTTTSLRGIALYEPSELVMSAGAGTPLSAVEVELAGRGQMLAFEPIDLALQVKVLTSLIIHLLKQLLNHLFQYSHI